jgi:hypothetical protein
MTDQPQAWLGGAATSRPAPTATHSAATGRTHRVDGFEERQCMALSGADEQLEEPKESRAV